VPFHAVSFPATLIGSGEPWKTVDLIKGFHWLNYEGGKFSTSAGRGIFTDQALEELPADYWRWWLIANAPETADTDFDTAVRRRREQGPRRHLGQPRQPHRQLYASRLRRPHSLRWRAFRQPETALAAELDQRIASLRTCHEACEFRRAAAENAGHLERGERLSPARRAVDGHQDPTSRARRVVTRTGLNLVRLCAVLAWSIVPALSGTVLQAFGDDRAIPDWPSGPCELLLDRGAGTRISRLDPLVPKISREKADHLAARFGG
jgi:methionyl-tRNA synthetase